MLYLNINYDFTTMIIVSGFLTAKYHASKEKPKVLTAVSTFLSGARDRDGGRAQRNKNIEILEQ